MSHQVSGMPELTTLGAGALVAVAIGLWFCRDRLLPKFLRSQDVTLVDKILNVLLPLFVPSSQIPKKPSKLFAFRKAFVSWPALKPYHDFVCKGTVATISVPRRDGTGDVEVLMHSPPPLGDGPMENSMELIVYYHGGGFTAGSAQDAYGANTVAALTRASGRLFVWASVEYRLAPEHAHPAAAHDCIDAARHLLTSAACAARFGYDRDRVHLFGLSAGGNLALVTAAALVRSPPPGAPSVASLCCDQPFVCATCNTPSYAENDDFRIAPTAWLRWCWRVYLKQGGEASAAELRAALDDPLCCPHTAAGALAGRVAFPPTLVLTALGDPLRDEGRACLAALRTAGARVDHLEMRASHAVGCDILSGARAAAVAKWAALM